MCEKWDCQAPRATCDFVSKLKDDMRESLSHLNNTRNNIQHPTYRAFAELGKAVKTVFLCRYLSDENLRREINEGLNVVER